MLPSGSKLPFASFQSRVNAWVLETFGRDITRHDRDPSQGLSEDSRFMEEAIELFQALGNTPEHLWRLARDVFAKQAGDPAQELGGVQTTLAALASAHRLDMVAAREEELARMWTACEAIRVKAAAKPRYGAVTIDHEPVRRFENNWEPTVAQLHSACYNMRHDFGLLPKEEQALILSEARSWLVAWLKELPETPQLRRPPVSSPKA